MIKYANFVFTVLLSEKGKPVSFSKYTPSQLKVLLSETGYPFSDEPTNKWCMGPLSQ